MTILSQIEQQPYSLDIAVSRKKELDGKFFGPAQVRSKLVHVQRDNGILARELKAVMAQLEEAKQEAESLTKQLQAAYADIASRDQLIKKYEKELLSIGGEISPEQKGQAVWITDIIRAVSKRYKIPVVGIVGRCRTQKYKQPRFEVCYFARKEGWTLGQIGGQLGGRDHTSVMHGANRYEEWQRHKAGTGELRPHDRDIDLDLVIPEGGRIYVEGDAS